MNSFSSKPLITTVIPTYRRPKSLQRAIQSVLNQTYPSFQVCVYDNASGDDTSAVVAEIAKKDPRVKYHCHPKNIGAAANFNYGMKQVTTPYFSLLSDDNTLLPNFFEDAINTLNCYQEAILFAGQTIRINEKDQKLGGSLDRWNSGLILPPDGLLHIVEKGLPNWESVLFKTEVINSVGLLNPSFSGAVDQDFIMRIARNHVLYISKKPNALFLCHDKSWSVNRDLSVRISSYKKILEQWLQDEELPEAVKERIRKRWKIIANKIISHHIYHKCIVSEEPEAIAKIMELMKKEVGLSFKPLRAIIVAKIANHDRFLKKLILTSVHLYLQLKKKFSSLKNRKNWEYEKI